jgi:hypothetical protein
MRFNIWQNECAWSLADEPACLHGGTGYQPVAAGNLPDVRNAGLAARHHGQVARVIRTHVNVA